MRAKVHLTQVVCVFSFAWALAACSGGDSGGGVAPVATPITGTFVDSPVNGLHYISVPSNPAGGVTANGGQYQCVEGDTVTFDLGGRVLGNPQPCGEQVTVLSVFGATSITDIRVRNLAQLLLTLSGIPAGSQPIELPASIPTSLPSRFNFSDPNFEQMLQAALSDKTLVTQEQVVAHLRSSFTTLTVSANGGQVRSIPAGIICTTGTCSYDFVAGTRMTLAALGPGFTGWSGGGCDGVGTCSVILDAIRAVRAVFLPPSPPPPGGGGTLTISGAPAIVGGTFVASPIHTQVDPPDFQMNIRVAWTEFVDEPIHGELLEIIFDSTTNLPQASTIGFQLTDGGTITLWSCEDFLTACGITVNGATGRVTFNNSVLSDLVSGAPPITLNGTLTFTPSTVPPTSLSITTASPLAAGTLNQAYSVTLTTSGGTQPFTWSVISGALPAGLTLNAVTGRISGTPTATGTFTFTIRVQDNSTTPRFHEKQFSLTINSSPPAGGGGTLTISGAPASVGGTFVVSPSLTLVKPPDPQTNIASVTWSEAPTALPIHSEIMGIAFDAANNVPQANVIGFSLFHGSVHTIWSCVELLSACGITVSGATGTVTFNNSVLTDIVSGAPPITLNGTLTFTPF